MIYNDYVEIFLVPFHVKNNYYNNLEIFSTNYEFSMIEIFIVNL